MVEILNSQVKDIRYGPTHCCLSMSGYIPGKSYQYLLTSVKSTPHPDKRQQNANVSFQ
jgi:hypothetical protein